MNVLVTNGFLNPEPLAELLPLIDAANIDLKSMDDGFYRKVCKAQLAPVLAAIRQFHAAGVHLELTNLVIPGHNDARRRRSTRLVDFVADLDPDIPLHFSAYHPAWKLEAPATPRATLVRARDLARRRLRYVYLGNTASGRGPRHRLPRVRRRGRRTVGAIRARQVRLSGGCLRRVRRRRPCLDWSRRCPQPFSHSSSVWLAVTQVVMPPRTNHSPRTSMKRGLHGRHQVVEDLVGRPSRGRRPRRGRTTGRASAT